MVSKISSKLGFVVAALGLFYLADNHLFFTKNPVTIVIQLLALGLMVWARITFKGRSFHISSDVTEVGLVTNGPYKWFRHPIYAAVIYASWASLIMFPKWVVLLMVLVISGGLFVRILLEEKALNEAFPEYVDYSKRTKRIIPFIF